MFTDDPEADYDRWCAEQPGDDDLQCRVCGEELGLRARDLGRDICKPCWEDEQDCIADQKLSERKDEGRR